MYIVASDRVEAKNCSITGNHALYSGGGISTGENSISTWISCQCSFNFVSKRDGGCIALDGSSRATFVASEFQFNSAHEGYGGAVYLSENANATFFNCDLQRVRSNITNNVTHHFRSNHAQQGGAGFSDSTSLFLGDGLNFMTNEGTVNGGGVATSGLHSRIVNSVFEFNSATNGGAIMVEYDGTAGQYAKNCTFRYL
mgnify:CR=1 FL=1